MSDIKEIYVVVGKNCSLEMAFVESSRAVAFVQDMSSSDNKLFIEKVELNMDETKINYTTVNSEEVKQQDKTVELNNLMNENKYLHSEIERLTGKNKELESKLMDINERINTAKCILSRW
jgi:predicted transcriptional regulator